MLVLIKLLIFGHVHEWEETGRQKLRGSTWNGDEGIIGVAVYCKCKKCGKPKAFELSC